MVLALQRDRGRQPTRWCRHTPGARAAARKDRPQRGNRPRTPRRRRDTLTDLRGDSQESVTPFENTDRMPLCVKKLRRSFLWGVTPLSDASSANLVSWPSSQPSMAVVLPHLQVVRPRFAAGAPPGPAASPTAGGSDRGMRSLARASAGCGRSVVTRAGSGLAEE